MFDELNELELVREDLEELTTEELADLKIELEDLLMDCNEILDDNDEDDE